MLNMMREQARQGESVTYNVAPSTEVLFLTAYNIAFCSACIASEHPPFESRGQPASGHSSSQLCVPDGGPLYPIEIIRVSLVSTAPTWRLIQCDRLTALFVYATILFGKF